MIFSLCSRTHLSNTRGVFSVTQGRFYRQNKEIAQKVVSCFLAREYHSQMGLFNPKERFIKSDSEFVEFENYSESTRERIIAPYKNFPVLIANIAYELNEVTKRAISGNGLGIDFIKGQLKQTKFLDIYRDKKSGLISQFVRLDVYENIPEKPISIGIFKDPSYSCGVRNAFGLLVLRELSDRTSVFNSNPSVIHVNCSFNPRGYEICKTICDEITPDIELIYKKAGLNNLPFDVSELRLSSIDAVIQMQTKKEISPHIASIYNNVIANIVDQTSKKGGENKNISVIKEYYLNKMRQCTGSSVPFDEKRSVFVGCVPISSETASNWSAHDRRITDFFRIFLDNHNGDMFFFYSEISYDQLKRKLACIPK